jgi:hypothetical protein
MTIGNANRHAESKDLLFLCAGKTPEKSQPLTCSDPRNSDLSGAGARPRKPA